MRVAVRALSQQELTRAPVAGRMFLALKGGWNGGVQPNYKDIYASIEGGISPCSLGLDPSSAVSPCSLGLDSSSAIFSPCSLGLGSSSAIRSNKDGESAGSS